MDLSNLSRCSSATRDQASLSGWPSTDIERGRKH